MPSATELGVESVQDTLTSLFGLEGVLRGDEYDIHCPDPKHVDSSPSCGVSLKTGYWNCFSCGVGGDLAALGARVLGRKRKDVIDLLRPSTPEALLSAVQRKIAAVTMPSSRRAKKASLVLPGPYEDGPLDEVLARDFDEATLRRWGVRFVPEQMLVGKNGEFTIRDSIAIPIRDEDSRLLAWCYRATKASPSWQPRYLYTPGVELSELWFGLQHNGPRKVQDITIAEGALDAMWVSQCGFPALALLGSKMGDRKVLRLQSYRSVTLFADRDSAGAQWIDRIGGMLGSKMPVRVVLYDKRLTRTYVDESDPDPKKRKVDPQMLMPIDVELHMARATPWSSFLLRAS